MKKKRLKSWNDAAKEVASWPKWKRDAAEDWYRRATEPYESDKPKCKCGFADCNNRGY